MALRAWAVARAAWRVGPRRLLYGGVALVGYILSPASWWNDLFVNVPLALAAALALEALTGLPREVGFTLAYWASNVAGTLMLLAGSEGAVRGRVTWRGLAAGLAASTAYTLAAVGALHYLRRGLLS